MQKNLNFLHIFYIKFKNSPFRAIFILYKIFITIFSKNFIYLFDVKILYIEIIRPYHEPLGHANLLEMEFILRIASSNHLNLYI